MDKIHPEILRRFGRDPRIIFKRDGWKCLICKSVEDLTIDHIDGNGRNSKKPNNNINNLRTICRKCHGSKDGKRGGGRRWIGYKPELNRYKKCLVCKKNFYILPSKFLISMTCSKECRLKYGWIYKYKN